MIDLGSVWRGLRVMKLRNGAKWAVKWMPRRFWLDAWTPVWHEGRGPYLSCGLWLVAVYRGF
jgi:hypothetical protein